MKSNEHEASNNRNRTNPNQPNRTHKHAAPVIGVGSGSVSVAAITQFGWGDCITLVPVSAYEYLTSFISDILVGRSFDTVAGRQTRRSLPSILPRCWFQLLTAANCSLPNLDTLIDTPP